MSEWVSQITEAEAVRSAACLEAMRMNLSVHAESAQKIAQDPYKAKALVAAVMKVGKMAGHRSIPQIGKEWKEVDLHGDEYVTDLERHARQQHSIMALAVWSVCGKQVDDVAISVAGTLDRVLSERNSSYTDIAMSIVESKFLSGFYAAMIGSLASER